MVDGSFPTANRTWRCVPQRLCENRATVGVKRIDRHAATRAVVMNGDDNNGIMMILAIALFQLCRKCVCVRVLWLLIVDCRCFPALSFFPASLGSRQSWWQRTQISRKRGNIPFSSFLNKLHSSIFESHWFAKTRSKGPGVFTILGCSSPHRETDGRTHHTSQGQH